MKVILWVYEILHHFETKGNHCVLVFIGQSSFEGFLGNAGVCPSTVAKPGHGCVLKSADPFSSKGEAYGKGGYKSKAGW